MTIQLAEFTIHAASIGTSREPVILSYWAGAGYHKHIERLHQSLIVYEHRFLILRADYDRRGWEANCARKVRAVLLAMRMLNRPVIWLDADAEIVKPFNYIDLLPRDCDISVLRPYIGQWPLVNSRLMSGTVGFNLTAKTDALLVKWGVFCANQGAEKLDQDLLLTAIEGSSMLKVHDLDPAFVCVRDLMPNVTDPYIVHHQASRQAECRHTNP